jgi:signal transduction histidine kinase
MPRQTGLVAIKSLFLTQRNAIVRQIVWVVGTVLVYLLTLTLLTPILGPSATALSAIPGIVIGWVLGLWPALITGLLTIFMTIAAMSFWVSGATLAATSIPDAFVVILTAVVVGRMHDLSHRLQHEVTARRRLEEDLRSSEGRVRLILEQSPAIFWTTDTNLRFTTSLGSKLTKLNYKANHFVGMTLFEFFQTNDPESLPIVSHEQALRGASIAFHLNWGGLSFDAHVEPLHDLRGRIVGTIGLAFDVTDRKRVEQNQVQLAVEREKLRLFEQLVKNVSHDLKTPLSSINTSVYLLEHLPEAAARTPQLENLKSSTQYLVKLVDSIFEMFQLDEGLTLRRRSIDLNTFARDLGVQTQSAASSKKINVWLDLADTLPTVVADAELLNRAARNLLDNAVKFTPEGGSITITTQATTEGVLLEVRDTGIGIDPIHLPHIFDRFYRVDPARPTTGIGLGLAKAHSIVQSHLGTIQVESTPGNGSAFKIVLPLTSPAILPINAMSIIDKTEPVSHLPA